MFNEHSHFKITEYQLKGSLLHNSFSWANCCCLFQVCRATLKNYVFQYSIDAIIKTWISKELYISHVQRSSIILSLYTFWFSLAVWRIVCILSICLFASESTGRLLRDRVSRFLKFLSFLKIFSSRKTIAQTMPLLFFNKYLVTSKHTHTHTHTHAHTHTHTHTHTRTHTQMHTHAHTRTYTASRWDL